MFLGEKPTLPVVAALVPIIGGVVLASTSELSFTWKGFLSGGRGRGCSRGGDSGPSVLVVRTAQEQHPSRVPGASARCMAGWLCSGRASCSQATPRPAQPLLLACWHPKSRS